MPYRLTPLQSIKKALKSTKALIARIEAELSDERTDKAERSRLLVSLAKLTKDVRSLENKRAKLSAQARGKMPLLNRLIGLQNLEFVRRGDGCLMASYSYRNQSFEVPIPNSRNQTSMAKYPAFVASRDAAERQARQIQDALDKQCDKQSKTEPEQIDISKVAAILGKHNGKHICDEGCRLFGCSVQDAARVATAVSEPAAVVEPVSSEAEPVTVEAMPPTVDINIEPVSVVPAYVAKPLPPEHSSSVEQWINSITPKQVKIVPVADLENQTLEYWKEKVTVTVRRMMELYRGFSCTLSFEAGMQFDNFQRQLIPMLGKVLYHDPEAVKRIVGDDAKILLGSNAVYDKPVIDAPTQMRFMTLTRKENRPVSVLQDVLQT